MILKGPEAQFLLGILIIPGNTVKSRNLWIFQWFHWISWKSRKSLAAPTGRGQPAQALWNKANYIGSGGVDPHRNPQNQPGSLKIIYFAFPVIFCGILPEIVEFSDFLVNSTRMRYFGGPVLEYLYFLWYFNDSGHPNCWISIEFHDFHQI